MIGIKTDFIFYNPRYGLVQMNNRFLSLLGGLLVLVTARHLVAGPLDEWSLRFPYPTAQTLIAVTYGGGQFVAVGASGTIISSPDGYNWTNRTSGVWNTLRGVAYADGEYAAIGDGGIILVSTNLASWTQISPLTNTTFHGIVGNSGWQQYNLPQFLAVGDGGNVMFCRSNFVWTNAASGNPNNLYGATLTSNVFPFGNGPVYLIVGDNGTVLRYSGTFQQISTNTLKTANNLYSIASAGGSFIAIGGDLTVNPQTVLSKMTNQMLYTQNGGTSWKKQIWIFGGSDYYPNTNLWQLSEEFILTSMTYGTNGFVGVGYTGNSLEYHPGVIMTSAMGTNWIEMPSTTSLNGLSGVAYGNGLYVAVGDYGEIVVSTNAVDWTELNAPHRNAIIAMAANTNNLCIALSLNAWYNWGFPNFRVLVSTNGSNWKSARTRFELPVITDLTCDGNRFVGVSGATIYTTIDGYDWQTVSGFTNALNGVRYLNGQFFAVGDNGAIYKSADGTNWSNQTITTTGAFDGVAYGNGFYLTAGTIAATSPDGSNWTLCSSNPPTRVSRMTFGLGIFVASGYCQPIGYLMQTGPILNTTDGVNWQPQEFGFGIGNVVYVGGTFVASLNGQSLSINSTDGINWGYNGFSTSFNYLSQYYSRQASGCASAVCAYYGTFLVGGGEGMMIQSQSILEPAVFTSAQANAGSFNLAYNQQIDLPYRIQASSNLISWETVFSGMGSGQPTNLNFPASVNYPSRFFRIVSP